MSARTLTTGLLSIFISLTAYAGDPYAFHPTPPHCGTPPIPPAPPDSERRPVDLVICLDTSGSMTALIDSARSRLWDVVNELSRARPTPRLRVGLLTYGSPSCSTAAQGWVVRRIDLTDDLDSVYAKMMAMTTHGGDEFVGWVINDALRTMSWTRDPHALKLIYVAGNESADQAANRFNFRYVSEQAREQAIVINAIYAGDRNQGINENWHEVARYGGGAFAAIDMQCGTVQIPTPHDDALFKLNLELNATYVPYGTHGDEGAQNQMRQDANAERMGKQSCSSRVAAKSSDLYSNSAWDLIDACKERHFKLEEVRTEELPEIMRRMNPEQRRAYVEGMKKSRETIQAKIQEANSAREEFVKREKSKQQGGAIGLDDAMLQALREQARARGFEFE